MTTTAIIPTPKPKLMGGKAKPNRPPNLTIKNRPSSVLLDTESPLALSSDEEEDEELLRLDSEEESGPSESSSPLPEMPKLKLASSSDEEEDKVVGEEDISKDLEALERLRNSVKNNLRLRPIRSSSALRKRALGMGVVQEDGAQSQSPAPSTTPSSSSSQASAGWGMDTVISPTSASSTATSYFTPIDETQELLMPPAQELLVPSTFTPRTLSANTPRTPYTPSVHTPRTPYTPPTPNTRPAKPISSSQLFGRLMSTSKRPIVVDTRPLAVHTNFHIQHSVPIAIPSLILKRCRKAGAGGQFQSLDALRQFITTPHGQMVWDLMIHSGSDGLWDGDIIVYDEDMDLKDRESMAHTAWALLPVLQQLLNIGRDMSTEEESGRKADYLEGGIGRAGHDPELATLVVGSGEDGEFEADGASDRAAVAGEDDTRGKLKPKLGLGGGGGLFQLDTQQPYKPKTDVEIDQTLSANSMTSSSGFSESAPSGFSSTSTDSDVTTRPLHSTLPVLSAQPRSLKERDSSPLPSPLPVMPSSMTTSSPSPRTSSFKTPHTSYHTPYTSYHTPYTSIAPPPLSNMPTIHGTSGALPADIIDASPSPPPSLSSSSFPTLPYSHRPSQHLPSSSKQSLTASSLAFRRPPPPGQGSFTRRPSAPNLRIGTGSLSVNTNGVAPAIPEKRLPKLSLNTGGVGGLGVGGERGSASFGAKRMGKVRSATLAVPPLSLHGFDRSSGSFGFGALDRDAYTTGPGSSYPLSSVPSISSDHSDQNQNDKGNGLYLHPPSPSHLNLTHSNHSPPGSARLLGGFNLPKQSSRESLVGVKPPPSPGFAKTSFGAELDRDRWIGGNKDESKTRDASRGTDIDQPHPSSPALSSSSLSSSSVGSTSDSAGRDENGRGRERSDSVTSLESVGSNGSGFGNEKTRTSQSLSTSNGPKTAYFTPPHTPTQAYTSSHPSYSDPKSHSQFFGYGKGSHRPEEDELPPSPKTARPDAEGFPGSPSAGFFPPTQNGYLAAGGSGMDGQWLDPPIHPHAASGWPGEPPSPSFSYGYYPSAPASAYPHSPRSNSFGSGAGGFAHSDPSLLYPPPSTESENESEGDAMSFTVSTILPGFLFLGPEPTTWENVEELRTLGVRRIVNLAAECGPDDWGLGLDRPPVPGGGAQGKESMTKEGKESEANGMSSYSGAGFEKYFKIPMRDTVEEDGIGRGVRFVCEILDSARLHSAPTYVHCKAGKSRSVTAVIAYLIHANHWPLSKAYSFVLERRKGISPNIGFVSELMGFEEEELGGKSGGVNGVGGRAAAGAGKFAHGHAHGRAHGNGGAAGGYGPQPSAPAATEDNGGGGAGMGGNYGVAAGSKRAGHVRESMPPPVVHHGHSYSVVEPSSHFGPDALSTTAFAGPSPELNGSHAANGFSNVGGPSFPPLSAGGLLALGDAGQELEIRDAYGRYRHARRAPVNETTLQPMRRVSKAGLESGEFYRGGVVGMDDTDEVAVDEQE